MSPFVRAVYILLLMVRLGEEFRREKKGRKIRVVFLLMLESNLKNKGKNLNFFI